MVRTRNFFSASSWSFAFASTVPASASFILICLWSLGGLRVLWSVISRSERRKFGKKNRRLRGLWLRRSMDHTVREVLFGMRAPECNAESAPSYRRRSTLLQARLDISWQSYSLPLVFGSASGSERPNCRMKLMVPREMFLCLACMLLWAEGTGVQNCYIW